MTIASSHETAIRRARKLSNRRIAAHDADGAVAMTDEGVFVVPSGGGPIAGRAALRAAFAAGFADPDFITYERVPDSIAIGPTGATATETGRWKGMWRDHALTGTYTARWCLEDGRWLTLSETFLPDGETNVATGAKA